MDPGRPARFGGLSRSPRLLFILVDHTLFATVPLPTLPPVDCASACRIVSEHVRTASSCAEAWSVSRSPLRICHLPRRFGRGPCRVSRSSGDLQQRATRFACRDGGQCSVQQTAAALLRSRTKCCIGGPAPPPPPLWPPFPATHVSH